MLRSAEVWPAMGDAFAAAPGRSRIASSPRSTPRSRRRRLPRPAGGGARRRDRQTDAPAHERVFDLRVDDHPEPLAELRRLQRMAAGYRRRNRIEAGADAEEEGAAARAAGLPDEDVVAAVVFAHARNGDVERAAALVAEIVAAEPLWRAAFERYETLGLLPEGIVPANG